MKEATVWFTRSTDTIKGHLFCPSCTSKKVAYFPVVSVQCDDCGRKYKTDLKQSIAEKKMGEIVSKLNYNDRVTIIAEQYYEEPLNHVKSLYCNQPLWEISKVQTVILKDHNVCKHCGYCNKCYTCTRCKSQIKPDKNGYVKKECPSCGYKPKKLEHSFIKTNNNQCPHCGSSDIKYTRTAKRLCPKCDNKNLELGRDKDMLQIVFNRKAPYLLDNLP